MCAIIGAELAHNMLHVSLYSLLSDEELLRDVTVAIAVHLSDEGSPLPDQ